MHRWSLLILVAVLLVWIAPPLLGQVSELNEASAFASNSVKVDFEGPFAGAAAENVYSGWGVVFSGAGSSNPRIEEVYVLNFSNKMLRNAPTLGSSSGKPLVLNFKFPLKKVGFNLVEITSGVQVSLQAYDDSGASLGTIQKTGLSGTVFIGIATSNARGISKLVVSYGAESDPERIDNLKMEYLQRPEFRNYLAQVADGPIGGGSYLQTTITVTNLTNSTATGEVAFRHSDGTALALPIGGVAQDNVALAIPAFSSVTLTTDGTLSPASSGYAVIDSNVPVGGTAIFRIASGAGAVTTEAGVGAEVGATVAVGAVQKAAVGSFNSGIAVVNTGTTTADAGIEAYDQAGNLVAFNNSLLDLPAGNHTAKFLQEIFPDLAGTDFTGTIRIRSDVPLAIVILRTSRGLVMSSLPVGSLQK